MPPPSAPGSTDTTGSSTAAMKSAPQHALPAHDLERRDGQVRHEVVLEGDLPGLHSLHAHACPSGAQQHPGNEDCAQHARKMHMTLRSAERSNGIHQSSHTIGLASLPACAKHGQVHPIRFTACL